MPETRPAQRAVIDDAQLKRARRAERADTVLDELWYYAVTYALIAVNVVVFAVEVFLSGAWSTGWRLDIPTATLVDMGAMYAPLIQGPADLWRFVTPMFLHLDVMHLAFNMVALFSVGCLLEDVLGRGRLVLLYFVGGITGNAVSYAADMLSVASGAASGFTVSAGASTSVFALFVAVALLGLLMRGERGIYREYSRGMLGVIAANVLYTFLVPGISIGGHLGGAVGGIIAMFMLPSADLRGPAALRIVVAVAWAAALAAMLAWAGIL